MSWGKKALGFVLAAMLGVSLVLAGCGVGIGPTREVVIDEPLGSAAVTDVILGMGAGKLTVGPGGKGLVSGVVRCNVEPWLPKVTRTDSSLAIRQGSQKGLSGLGTDIVNEWDLELGNAPLRLKVTAGAYEGTYELGGLSLRSLSVRDRASKSKVSFSLPNPSQMDELKYETGASTVTLVGLARANFKKMEFKGGAGSFTFDFSGDLRTSGAVSIGAGVASVRIVVPAGTATKVTLSGSLTEVTKEGSWVTSGKTYSTPALGAEEGKVLAITVHMDVGSLKLTSQ